MFRLPQILFAMIIIASSSAMAQTMRYSYDAAGNRIKREIVLNANKSPKQASESFFTDRISDIDIKIYPNPTQGQLKVEIVNLEKDDECALSLYSMSGLQIYSKQVTESPIDLDISGQPNGIYIMQILINGSNTSWKIIKE